MDIDNIKDTVINGVPLVEIDFLGHNADTGFRGCQILINIVTEYFDGAAALIDERSDYPDRGCFAGAIGAK